MKGSSHGLFCMSTGMKTYLAALSECRLPTLGPVAGLSNVILTGNAYPGNHHGSQPPVVSIVLAAVLQQSLVLLPLRPWNNPGLAHGWLLDPSNKAYIVESTHPSRARDSLYLLLYHSPLVSPRQPLRWATNRNPPLRT